MTPDDLRLPSPMPRRLRESSRAAPLTPNSFAMQLPSPNAPRYSPGLLPNAPSTLASPLRFPDVLGYGRPATSLGVVVQRASPKGRHTAARQRVKAACHVLGCGRPNAGPAGPSA